MNTFYTPRHFSFRSSQSPLSLSQSNISKELSTLIIYVSCLCLLSIWVRVCKSALEKEKVNIMQIYSLRAGHIKGRGGLLEKTLHAWEGKVRAATRGMIVQEYAEPKSRLESTSRKETGLEAEGDESCHTEERR